jgi:hypothetical protein
MPLEGYGFELYRVSSPIQMMLITLNFIVGIKFKKDFGLNLCQTYTNLQVESYKSP